MPRSQRELNELAKFCGLQTSYYDDSQKRQNASPESLLAALRALGIAIQSVDEVPAVLAAQKRQATARGVEPVIVAWVGDAADVELCLPRDHSSGRVQMTLRLDTGEERRAEVTLDQVPDATAGNGNPEVCVRKRLKTPGDVPHGYHQLILDTPTGRHESLLISAPRKAYVPDDPRLARTWGCFLPLYALRSQQSWSAGNYTDLEHFMEWIGELGGGVVATLPLLASYLDEPFEPSPYSPVSRLLWNEFYIDLTQVPELQQCGEARQLLESAETRSTVAELHATEYVDYKRQMELMRRILEPMAECFFENRTARFDAFNRFLEDVPYVNDYAAFRATHERQRINWQQWPERQRNGRLTPEDYDERVKRYHLYAQFVATEQMRNLSNRARAAGVGLYLDLPLGTRPDGYDVWRNRDSFVADASAGAPPDAIFTKGQNWGFAPLHPQRIRENHYRHVRDYLHQHLRFARLLRIDHAMGLHRLYWIPPGMAADRGVYVTYHADELYAILCLESHRHQVSIVGENLGTVPSYINKALNGHQIRQMYVVQYEFKPDKKEILGPVSKGSVASINTHDMPTFAAWWAGDDIADRRDLGLMNDDEADAERRTREQVKERYIAWLSERGWLQRDGSAADFDTVLRASLRFLSDSSAQVVLVNLEDLWRETRPQNVPGTWRERPNWQRKATRDFEEFSHLPEVLEVLQMVNQLRQQSGRAAPSGPTRAKQTDRARAI